MATGAAGNERHCVILKTRRANYAMNDERITELEIKLCLVEDMAEELNRTVFRQQAQIDLLQAQLRHFYGQLQASTDTAAAEKPFSLRDEIPPHY